MSKKKEKPICLSKLEPEEKLKYEIAEELGLLDKVLEDGWKALSSKETGRIGGLITKKRREMEKAKEEGPKCEQFRTGLEKRREICYNRKTGEKQQVRL